MGITGNPWQYEFDGVPSFQEWALFMWGILVTHGSVNLMVLITLDILNLLL